MPKIIKLSVDKSHHSDLFGLWLVVDGLHYEGTPLVQGEWVTFGMTIVNLLGTFGLGIVSLLK